MNLNGTEIPFMASVEELSEIFERIAIAADAVPVFDDDSFAILKVLTDLQTHLPITDCLWLPSIQEYRLIFRLPDISGSSLYLHLLCVGDKYQIHDDGYILRDADHPDAATKVANGLKSLFPESVRLESQKNGKQTLIVLTSDETQLCSCIVQLVFAMGMLSRL